MCAEWENGGLPHWLTGELGPRARTRDARFLGHLERFGSAGCWPKVVPASSTGAAR
ncbi:beta-galactosidase [Streptomyces sp. L7]